MHLNVETQPCCCANCGRNGSSVKTGVETCVPGTSSVRSRSNSRFSQFSASFFAKTNNSRTDCLLFIFCRKYKNETEHFYYENLTRRFVFIFIILLFFQVKWDNYPINSVSTCIFQCTYVKNATRSSISDDWRIWLFRFLPFFLLQRENLHFF